jgi:hypothetical protein
LKVTPVLAGLGTFLGINGLGRLIYVSLVECVERIGDTCYNRVDTPVMLEGWTEAQLTTTCLGLSLICTALAVILTLGESE